MITRKKNSAELNNLLAELVRMEDEAVVDEEFLVFARGIIADYPFEGNDQLKAVLEYVRSHVGYQPDPSSTEMFTSPHRMMELVKLGTAYGDCFSGNTEIICIDSDGRYAIRRIGDIEVGSSVLSYNFSSHTYEPKVVLNKMNKGVRPVVNVKLYNGCSFTCTPDHVFFRINQVIHSWKKSGDSPVGLSSVVPSRAAVKGAIRNWFFEERLSDILHKQRYGKYLVSAREIPILGKLDLPIEQMWLEGAYAAEGWSENSHVCISGSDPAYRADTASNLKTIGAPFSDHPRNGQSYFTIKASSFSALLAQMGNKADGKHWFESRLSGNRLQVEALLDGYGRGDTYFNHNTNYNRVLVHNTSSNLLASQLRFMHLLLGRPLYSLCEKNHQGAGKKPIWRLQETKTSAFNREIVSGVSKIGIKSATEKNAEEVFDISVADNHNFILNDSFVIAHNCDCIALFGTAICRALGYNSHIILLDQTGTGFNHAAVEVYSESLGSRFYMDATRPEPLTIASTKTRNEPGSSLTPAYKVKLEVR